MPSHPRSRVLCVDDDPDACEMLSELLKLSGIDVTVRRFRRCEAWRMIRTERFDLYLLDAWLPNLDGFEFCRQIRELIQSLLFSSTPALPTTVTSKWELLREPMLTWLSQRLGASLRPCRV